MYKLIYNSDVMSGELHYTELRRAYRAAHSLARELSSPEFDENAYNAETRVYSPGGNRIVTIRAAAYNRGNVIIF